MPAAADRNLEIELMGELDGRHDVGHAAAARDQRRALVDHAVVDAPRRLVAIVVRLEKQAAETGRKLVEAIEKCSYRQRTILFDCRMASLGRWSRMRTERTIQAGFTARRVTPTGVD